MHRIAISIQTAVLLAATLLASLHTAPAEARNWGCGSTIQIRGFMSYTDFMHKGQGTIALTTWPGGIGNHWRLLGPRDDGGSCREHADGTILTKVISWEGGALR